MKLEFDYVKMKIEEKNGYELLSKDYINARTPLSVKCDKGHIYTPTFDNFSKGHYCSYCNKNGKITIDMLNCVLKSLKYTPVDISNFKNSKFKILVKCDKGHVYKTSWGSLNCGSRCPKCTGGVRLPYDDINEKISAVGYKLISKTYKNANTKLEIECDKGHRYFGIYSNFYQGHRCPKCTGSNTEQELKEFFTSLEMTFLENDKKLISPHELDIVFPDKKIAVEYCGLVFHGELLFGRKNKRKTYHLNKLERCTDIGYKLITIFSDEWLTKKDIVKDRLKHIILKSSERIYARKCVISEITSKQASEFVDRHHIQGYTGSRVKLGAFYDNRLVAVMTFASGSISKGESNVKNTWELSRFCVSDNVIGIAGKLLEHFKKNYEWDNIFSYADRRWSDGNLYRTIGFDFKHNTSPNYWYFKEETKRHHRFNFRKDKIKHLGNGEQTEWEIMQEQGWNRIWDCGSMKFEMVKILLDKC